MKIYFTLTFSILISSLFAQVDEINTKKDYSKDKLKSIDYCSYFKTTINETDKTITGYYHFDVGKVVEEINGSSKTYFYWDNKLFSVFDSKINKQFFFKGDFKNASDKLYDYYSKKASEYLTLFEPYLVKTNLRISFNSKYHPRLNIYKYSVSAKKEELEKIGCIIKEDERFQVKRMSISYAYQGLDSEQITNSCNLPDNIKNVLKHNGIRLYFIFIIIDKKLNQSMLLPEIAVRVY